MEIIIKDGIIMDIREEVLVVVLDKSEYFLVVIGNYVKNLKINFKVGDKVSLKIDFFILFEKIKVVVFGNIFLLKDGKILIFIYEIVGRYLCFVIGIDKSGWYFYFVVVDGWNGKSIGLL